MTKNTAATTAPIARRFAAFAGTLALAGCLALTGCGTTAETAVDSTATDDAAATQAADAAATQAADADVTEQAADEAGKIEVKVQISDDSDEASSVAMSSATATVDEGASVLDALNAIDVEAEVVESSYGPYVSSIMGLGEDDSHGWTYTVNGEMAMVGASEYTLEDGDEVAWSYIVYNF